jgi:hypothetical protein
MRKALVMAIMGLGLLFGGGLAEGRQARFRTTEASSRDPMSIALDFIRADGRTRGLTEADLRDVMVLSRTVAGLARP